MILLKSTLKVCDKTQNGTSIAGHETTIATLETDLATANTTIAGHETTIATLETDLATANTTISGHETTIATLENDLNDANEYIDLLGGNNLDAQITYVVDSIEQESIDISVEVSELESHVEKLIVQIFNQENMLVESVR